MPLIFDPQTGEVTQELPERPTRASSSPKPKTKRQKLTKEQRDALRQFEFMSNVAETIQGGPQMARFNRAAAQAEDEAVRQTVRDVGRRTGPSQSFGKKDRGQFRGDLSGVPFREPLNRRQAFIAESSNPNIRGMRASTPEERQLDTRYEVNRDMGLDKLAQWVDVTTQELGDFAVTLPKNVAQLALSVGNKLQQMRGVEVDPQFAEAAAAAETATQPYREKVRALFPTDVALDQTFLHGQLPHAMASTLPYVALGAAGAGGYGAVALGAIQNAGQTFEDAIKSGADPETALRAALLGGAIGTSEGVLGTGKVGFLERMAERGVVGGAAHGALEETVQEVFSQIANNVNARLGSGYDPKRAFLAGVKDAAKTSAVVGALFGGGPGVLSRLSSVPQRETSIPPRIREFSPIADNLPDSNVDVDALPYAQQVQVKNARMYAGLAGETSNIILNSDGSVTVSTSRNPEGVTFDRKGKVAGVTSSGVKPPKPAKSSASPKAERQTFTGDANSITYPDYPGAEFAIRKVGSKWEFYEKQTGEIMAVETTKARAAQIGRVRLDNAFMYMGLMDPELRDKATFLEAAFGISPGKAAIQDWPETKTFSDPDTKTIADISLIDSADDFAPGLSETVGLSPEQPVYFFNRLQSNDPGKGGGTKVLREVLAFSDQTGVPIVNHVSAYGNLSQAQLVEFYARHGFETVSLPDLGEDETLMVYRPRSFSPVADDRLDVEDGARRFVSQADPRLRLPDGSPRAVYHGTQSPVEITQIDPSKFDPNALYGPGFYTTQDSEVAAGDEGYVSTKPPQPGHDIVVPTRVMEFFRDRVGIEKPLEAFKRANDQDLSYWIFSKYGDTDPDLADRLQTDLDENMPKWLEEADAFNQPKPHAYKLYLDIRRPFDIDRNYTVNEVEQLLDSAKVLGLAKDYNIESLLYEIRQDGFISGHNLYVSLNRILGGKVNTNAYLQGEGYDGITHSGGRESTPRRFDSLEEAQQVAERVGANVTTRENELDYDSPEYATYQEFKKRENDEIERRAALYQEEAIRQSPVTGRSLTSDELDQIIEAAQIRAEAELDEERNAILETVPRKAPYYEVKGHRVWIAFKPEQVKSATGNRGTYDPTSQRMSEDRASKGRRLRQTDEEDMIRRWNVPRWDPRVNKEPASQMVQFARFEFRPHGNRGRIYTNNIGTVILKAVDHMVQQGKSVTNPSNELTQDWFSHGRAVPVWVAEEHIKWLNENAHQSPVLESLRDEMTRAVAAAIRRGQEAIPFVSLDRTDVDSIRQTIRHEDIHRWQWGNESMYGYVVDPLWAKLQPWYDHAVAALRRQGYNFPTKMDGSYTVELFAHLGAGQHGRLGFTAEQGAQVMASIMKHIVETRGLAALKNLALDIKVKERINDLARVSERSGPRATAVVPVTEYSIKPSGGIRERLSKWFGPRGGSETAVPPRGAEDFENVDASVDPPGRWERLKTALRGHGLPFEFTWLDKLKRLGIDEAHPILKAWHFIQTGQEAPSQNAEYLLRLWLGSNGKVDRIFSEGMIDGQNKIVTPGGLDWLLGPWQGLSKSQMMDEMEAAIHMMVAERTLELATKKWGQPNSGLSITAPISGVADTVTLQQQAGDQFMADIQASIRKLNQLQQRDPQALGRIQEAADRYRKWARALLDYQLEKGRLKQETYDQLVANGDYYVDMHRLFDDDPDSMLDSTPSKYGKVKKLMRKFKGSREEISNPYVNLMIATQQTIKESDRNYAMNAFVEPLRQPQSDPQMQTLYHMIGHRTPQATRDSIRVYNQGTEEHWEFHPEIEAALKGYGDIPGNVITDVLTLPFKILRTAITHTPGFLFRNFVRDAQQRTLLSRGNTSIRQILNPLEGSKPWDALTQIIRPLSKADRDSFWLTGASQAGYYANSRIDWQARLRDAVNDVRGDRSVLLAFPEQLWQFIAKDLPAGVENINRFAEFKEQRKQALAQGMSQYDADIKAAFEARDLMDFAVSGTAVKQLNKFVMFLNPALQGIKRTAKSAREAPLPFLFRWSLYALMPALGELWWNFGQGDDTLNEWRNMPAWRKDLFYNLKVGDDKWLAIPKPFELGVAASLTNRLIDYSVLDNKQAFDDAGKSIWRSLMPVDDWSKLVGPFLSVAEVGSNWSYFYDEHIIPPGQEGRDPDLAKKRGSFVGQQIAKIVDKDPRMIDYFLRANLSDWATIANYTGELFNAELNPKERSEIYKKLVTLSTGNVVRPTKPDQAVDVKRVMNAATRTYGDRADWYTPLTDYINAYRDTPDAGEREKVVRDALAYASRVRQFLPQLDKDLKESIQKLEKLEATDPSYKSLDKKAQGVVDSRLRSDLRSFDHEIMTARVRGDKIAEAQAIVNKRSYNLSLALAQEILQYREQTQEKALERRVTPPMPRR